MTSTIIEKNKQKGLKKIIGGSAYGNMIEWFDYATYGYLATVIAFVFFAPGNESAALLNTFAIFALSFIVRPIGGVVWGYYGDRIGRRKVLILTMCMMSLATFTIGIIPNYETIGVFAPILLLLCRIIQGFSASGEYAGAALMIAEHAPAKKRGLMVSMIPASTAAGMLLGAGVAAILEFSLNTQALYSWGWRIPFLMSLPLGLIGLYIRLKMEDSPVYNEMIEKKEKLEIKQLGIIEGIQKNFKKILIAMGVISLNAVGFYIILSYMPTYLTTALGFDHLQSTLTTIVTLLTYIFLPIVGSLTDRVGRKPVLITACIFFILFTYSIFYLMSMGGIFTILSLIILGAILACNDGVLATFLSEMFPTEVRYSGFALSFNTGNALFGGTAPYIATFLIATTGNNFAPAFYLMAGAIIALIALLKTTETTNISLSEIKGTEVLIEESETEKNQPHNRSGFNWIRMNSKRRDI
ncbi:MFS transporter [Oceanobacillus polygoni]|uniref:Putative proline/betaine transporter n=1 Tax=Oceanobacillus polygoni TaxID=1235259 RepID=A0A9X0YP20_9BACI|nr:MFS transporter [Oceanobacillus polygoni]MBP2076114.1 MHS family proline/betaine transporter-like MFS transporter [Oceanobacillus polygoni]